MKKYASIANKETKELNVFEGIETIENIKWAIETCNMSLMEVEKTDDGRYFLAGYLPEIPLTELKDKKKQELKNIRDQYKEDSGFKEYVFENLQFGIVEDEEEKNKWFLFLKDLVEKYDAFKEQIYEAKSKEDLDKIGIEF